jgi:RimJ/RimL family protein N-acetyltransferase
MHQITATEVTPALHALFRTDEPQARRCFTVLDGAQPRGKILCADPANPTWAAVVEPTDNTLYFGGNVNAEIVATLFDSLRQRYDVLVGMWPDDPRLAWLPPNPDYDGRTLEFYDRHVGEGLDQYLHTLPEGCEIRRLDRDLIMRTQWGPNDVASWGGLDAWEENCFGYCLMRGDEILSEATVGPPAIGLYEPGIITHPDHRGHGYATIAVAHLMREIEASGLNTYWNCSKRNVASAAVARKLGYGVEKEYRCMVWNKIVG